MKSYEQQRRDRLQDVIDDYFQDEKISSRQIFEEVLSCINDVIKYHEKEYCRARDLYDLMNDQYLAEKWQYDKIPNRY
jgi:hypothetical protein|tara:strand:+ start:42 stop:275 length:234 start_codon:yes stop_codon:yes gene_type:complete